MTFEDSTKAREEEVFWWVCRLHSEKAAASRLGISVGVVKTYRKRLYSRIGALCRDDAMEMLGWVNLPVRPR